jgi:hypothetical protein
MSTDAVLVLFGPVAVAVTSWLKKFLGLSGIAALWLTMAVSVVLGFLAALATGQLSLSNPGDPVGFIETLLKDAGVVFAVATVLYRHVKEAADAAGEGS